MEELALRCAELDEQKRGNERNLHKLESEKRGLEKKLRDSDGNLQDANLARKREVAELETKLTGVVAAKEQVRQSFVHLYTI